MHPLTTPLDRKAAPRVLTAVLLAWCASPAAAQQSPAALQLVVFDAESGSSLEGAQVSVGTRWRTLTDESGGASVSGITPGNHFVDVRLIGYAPERFALEFSPGEVVEGEIDLLVQPIELDRVDVTADGRSATLLAAGFYERQQAGIGAFFTRSELEARRPSLLTDLFRTVRGLRVVPVRNGGNLLVTARESMNLTNGVCPVQVYVDGVQTFPDFNLDNIRYNQVEGIEVFLGPSEIPPRFNSIGTTCGVVLVWARVGH